MFLISALVVIKAANSQLVGKPYLTGLGKSGPLIRT